MFIVSFHSSALGQPPPGQSPCISKPDWYLKVSRPGTGWNLSIVDRGKQLGARRRALSSNPAFKDVFEAEYALLGKYFAFTEVVVEPCEHSVSLRTQHIKVEHAFGYSTSGTTFAIVLSGNCGRLEKRERIAACETAITLTDTNGTGKFDLLRFGVSGRDSVPSWAGRASKPPIVSE